MPCLNCIPIPISGLFFAAPIPILHSPHSPSTSPAASFCGRQPSVCRSPASPVLAVSVRYLYQVVLGKMNKKKKQVDKHGPLHGHMDTHDEEMDIRKIMKDVETFGYSHMSWKERKKIEDKKVVSLGGKAPKQQRLPLSVARPRMKKQKERERQMLHERLILGQFGGKLEGSSKKSAGKRRPEERGLKSGEGRFKNGVLNVKHLLNPAQSKDQTTETHGLSGGKWKKGNKKGGKKRR